MMLGVNDGARDHVRWLHRRWSSRFPGLGSVGESVIARYAEVSRVYHDVRHLREVLQRVDELAEASRDATAVELAAWFHDAIYDVHRDDNEEASAELAQRLLTPHAPAPQLAEVVRLVLLTRDHAVAAGDANGAVLCDADLAVLASGTAEYADYATRVRQEYAHVTDATFRDGRAKVLRGLLSLPALFHTTHGATHWEAAARANLAAELATLLSP